MGVSPYFDGCYFDPSYFDAAPCSTGGKPPKGRPPYRRIRLPEPPFIEEEGELFVLI